MNSPEKATHQVLGTSVEVIKDFLLDSVNLPDPIDTPHAIGTEPTANIVTDRSQFERWLRRWRRILAFKSQSESALIPSEQLELFAPIVRAALRRIWVEQDPRRRDWYLYRLRDDYHRMIVRAEDLDIVTVTEGQRMEQLEQTSRARGDNPEQKARFFREWMGADLVEDVPRICPFEAALYWLQNNQRLMLRCRGSMCAAPYFFRTEKGQRFCSPECADPARREAKLRWWNESPNSPKNKIVGKKRKTK